VFRGPRYDVRLGYTLQGVLTQTPGIIQPGLQSCSYFYITRRIALADETETAQRNVEDKQRVYCDANAIPDHARPSHDADACCQRPGYQHEVHRHSDNDGDADGAEGRGDDKREQRVADDRDGLEEGTVAVSIGSRVA
jgi:hypothetical protein